MLQFNKEVEQSVLWLKKNITQKRFKKLTYKTKRNRKIKYERLEYAGFTI